MENTTQASIPMANLMVKASTVGITVILTKAHSNKVQGKVSAK